MEDKIAKRELVVFATILAALFVLVLSVRPLMFNIVTARIKGAFPGCEVSVGDVEIRNIDTISVTEIKIQKEPALLYSIKSVDISFSPLFLFTRTIQKVRIKNADLQFTDPSQNLKDLVVCPTLRPFKGFTAKSVIVLTLVSVARTADWKFNISVDGNMEVRNTPAGETEIEGDFLIMPRDRKLSIGDETFLKRLAEKAKQPPAVVADLKDYDYTKCNLHISGKPESMSLHVMLDGAKDKKDLTIPLSGFFKE